jgi:hypothetical protein
MTKGKALLIAFLTVWPLIYIFIFLAIVFTFALSTLGKKPPADLPGYFILLFIAHGITMLLMLGMPIYYILHSYNNHQIPQDKKVLWALLLFLGNIIVMPVYWYLYMWKPLANPESQTLNSEPAVTAPRTDRPIQ